jgi:hypothetical protein
MYDKDGEIEPPLRGLLVFFQITSERRMLLDLATLSVRPWDDGMTNEL